MPRTMGAQAERHEHGRHDDAESQRPVGPAPFGQGPSPQGRREPLDVGTAHDAHRRTRGSSAAYSRSVMRLMITTAAPNTRVMPVISG